MPPATNEASHKITMQYGCKSCSIATWSYIVENVEVQLICRDAQSPDCQIVGLNCLNSGLSYIMKNMR